MLQNSEPSTPTTKLLAIELWGIGDVALAIPFLVEAARHAQVTLLAKPHASYLLKRFCPAVKHVPFVAPWTAFTAKYQLHQWPWAAFRETIHMLRREQFQSAVSARRDPRDHLLMRTSSASRRLGFGSRGSGILLTDNLSPPTRPHRIEHWQRLSTTLGWGTTTNPLKRVAPSAGVIVIHTGAGQPTRCWPVKHYLEIARRFTANGKKVVILDDGLKSFDKLIDILATADAFIGNDSGPGHIAAAAGVPTFTIFGPQLPELFAPIHPDSAWIAGAECRYKPCWDSCRFTHPQCIDSIDVDTVWTQVQLWMDKLKIN